MTYQRETEWRIVNTTINQRKDAENSTQDYWSKIFSQFWILYGAQAISSADTQYAVSTHAKKIVLSRR